MEHKHSVLDKDTHFIIDPVTRAITTTSEKLHVMQFDHNSERLTFEMPRYIEGHDMSVCNQVEAHFLNIDGKTKDQISGHRVLEDFRVSEEDENKVVVSWNITKGATKLGGKLNFLLNFRCVEDGVETYAWHTDFFTNYNVKAGLDAAALFESDYADVIEQWKASVMKYFKDDLTAWKAEAQAEVKAEVSREIAVERERIDNIIALKAGSTTGDAELQDMRVGADGKVYASAGTAIREQFNDMYFGLHNDSMLFGALVPNEYIDNNDGTIKTMSSYERTDYLDISGMDRLHVSAPATLSFCALYDENKDFIQSIVFGASESDYELPESAKYLMMSAGKGLLAQTIVKNRLWNIEKREIPNIAEETKTNKRGKEPLEAVFTIGTVLNGVINPNTIYRVTTRDIISYDRDITLRINRNGYQFGVAFYDSDVFVSQTGWITSEYEKFIPANTQFRVVVSPITAVWEKADVDALAAMVEIDTVIGDKFNKLKRDAVKKALFSPKKARFAAHRGLSAYAPENTLAAFVEAGKKGVFAIETDVYATSDGYFVLSHDNDISAYTNAPIGTNITENTFETVRSYSITKGANVSQYAGQKIPTLEEYLENCIMYGCVPMIEIKNILGKFDELVKVVNSYGFYEDAIYINYAVYYATIRKATGDCIVTVNLDGNTSYDEQIEDLKANGAYNVIVAMSPDIGEVTSELVKKCREYGYIVNVWTLNDAMDAEKYFRMGADLVTSDFLTKLF